jgi:hypothetical protein
LSLKADAPDYRIVQVPADFPLAIATAGGKSTERQGNDSNGVLALFPTGGRSLGD